MNILCKQPYNMIKILMAKIARLLQAASGAWGRCKLLRRINGGYAFSVKDRLRYVCFGSTPGCYGKYLALSRIQRHENGFDVVRYKNRQYYWPSTEGVAYLPWLYAEVFEPAWMNYHAYEYGPARIRPGDSVYDFGACEGFFVEYALRKGAAQVWAFEPTALAAEALRRSFQDAIYRNQVEIVETAVGAQAGSVKFVNNSGRIYDNCVAQNDTAVDRCVTVTQQKIDDVVLQSAVHFLKMDIEGGEMAALQGGEGVLRDQKPRLAVAVYHGYENAMLCKEIILQSNPKYTIVFRGLYAENTDDAPRPAMLFGW